MKTVLKIAGIALLAAAFLNAPQKVLAQNTNEPASPPKHSPGTNEVPKTQKKAVAGPFHGKLVALDKVAKTITVGKRTFQITSESRIKKASKPATLEDGVVGEPVSGYVKPTPDGKWIAVSVNFGPKPQESSAEQKKIKTQKNGSE